MEVLIAIIIAFIIWCAVGFLATLIASRNGAIRNDLSNSEVVNLSMCGLMTTIAIIMLVIEDSIKGNEWKITRFVNGNNKKNKKNKKEDM